MKKLTLISLTILLLISLTACVSDQEANNQINTSNVNITGDVQPDNVVENEPVTDAQTEIQPVSDATYGMQDIYDMVSCFGELKVND